MSDKRMSAAEVVAELESGMTIGIGGWGARRKPMALVRAIAASNLTDLRIVSYGGPDVGILCAMGKVRELVFGFVTLDVISLDPFFRTARQQGTIAAKELDEGMLQWGLYAAALRLPFLPTHAGLASDVLRLDPEMATIRSPYGGETLTAMPALRLDAALVHVDRADVSGNGQILGPDPYFDDLYCRAADRRYVSCEQLVPTAGLTEDACLHTLVLNRMMVDGVVEAPFGAHPTSCSPAYGIDRDHLEEYVASAATEASWLQYRDRYVTVDHETYVDAVGGTDRLARVPVTVF